LEHPVVKIVLLNNCAMKTLKWSILSSWSHKFSTGYCSTLGTFCECLYLATIKDHAAVLDFIRIKVLYLFFDSLIFRNLHTMINPHKCSGTVHNDFGMHLNLTHWHTQMPIRRSEPSMSFLLILAFCQ